MYDLNHLAKHLRSASLKKKDATFIHLHEDDQLISFEDFFENAEKIASALIYAGIRPGDRVAMQVENLDLSNDKNQTRVINSLIDLAALKAGAEAKMSPLSEALLKQTGLVRKRL